MGTSISPVGCAAHAQHAAITQSVVQSPTKHVALPTQEAELRAKLIEVLTQLTAAITQLQAALGAMQLGQTPSLAPGNGPMDATQGALPVEPAQSSNASPDPLRGFVVHGDTADRASLGQTIAQIDGTRVGKHMLALVRDKNVSLDIVSDAEFASATGKPVGSSIAVCIKRTGQPPMVLVRAAALKDPSSQDNVHILAHELTHAAQFLSGDEFTGDFSPFTYHRQSGGATTNLTQSQIETGVTLMNEAGAEYVSSLIGAELRNPTEFAAVLRDQARYNANRTEAIKYSWDAVASVEGYNPNRYTLPRAMSPVALQIETNALRG